MMVLGGYMMEKKDIGKTFLPYTLPLTSQHKHAIVGARFRSKDELFNHE